MQSRDKKEFNPSIRLLEGLIGRLQKIRWFDSSVQIDDIGVWLRSQVEWSVKIHLQRLRLLKFVKPGFGKQKVNYLRDSWSTAWNVNGDCKQLLDDLHSKARLLGDKLLQENAQKNQWRLEIKDKISDFFDDKLSAVETAPKGLTENDRRGVVRAIKSARRDCRSIASGFVCGYPNPWEPLLTVYELGFWPIGFATELGDSGYRDFYVLVPDMEATQNILISKAFVEEEGKFKSAIQRVENTIKIGAKRTVNAWQLSMAAAWVGVVLVLLFKTSLVSSIQDSWNAIEPVAWLISIALSVVVPFIGGIFRKPIQKTLQEWLVSRRLRKYGISEIQNDRETGQRDKKPAGIV